MDVQKLMSAEATVIGRMFEQNKIYARIDRKRSYVVNAGFLHYALTLRADQQFSAIERINRELSAALSTLRRRAGLPEIQVLPVSTGGFALETPHPQPQVLHWSGRALTSGQAHSMLLGESYAGAKATETVTFDDAPHILIAGITGSGKSVLMQHMLLSLTATTAPDALRIVAIDLKNEDLRPFVGLPHVVTFAGARDAAEQAIAAVVEEKNRRIENGAKPYRLLLIIDELAQLASNKTMVEALGDLASIGRSKWINLIAATQHPTEKGGLGSLLKANFPLRLVGQVAPGQSYAATGRAGLHADLLPGKGAFLRLQGATVKRFQSFFIDGDDVALMARKIGAHWGAAPAAPVQAETSLSLVCEDVAPASAPVRTSAKNEFAPPAAPPLHQLFPLTEKRPLNVAEAAEVRKLNKTTSKNQLCILVYGAKSTRYMDWLNDALSGSEDGKIIPFPRRAANG